MDVEKSSSKGVQSVLFWKEETDKKAIAPPYNVNFLSPEELFLNNYDVRNRKHD